MKKTNDSRTKNDPADVRNMMVVFRLSINENRIFRRSMRKAGSKSIADWVMDRTDDNGSK